MKRRDFLQSIAAYAVLSQMSSWAFASTQDQYLAICLNADAEADIDDGAPAIPGKLMLIHPKSLEQKLIDVPFLGHSPLQNPADPRQVIISLKWGKIAAEVDLKKMKTTQNIEALPNHRFFGHGTFSANGESYFLTELDDIKKVSVVVERSSKDHKVVRTLSSFGSYAHDLQLDKTGQLLLVMNAGRSGRKQGYAQVQANLSVIEAKSGRLVRQTVFPNGEVPSHFCLLEDESVLALGGNTIGPSFISHVDSKGQGNALPLPKDLHGQAFEAIQDGNTTWITFPHAYKVLRWDFEKKKLIENVKCKAMPRSLVKLPDEKIWLSTPKGIEVHKKIKVKKLADISTILPMFTHFSHIRSY